MKVKSYSVSSVTHWRLTYDRGSLSHLAPALGLPTNHTVCPRTRLELWPLHARRLWVPGLLSNHAPRTWPATAHLGDWLASPSQEPSSAHQEALLAPAPGPAQQPTAANSPNSCANSGTELGSGSHWILIICLHVYISPSEHRVSQRQKLSFIFVSRCHEGSSTWNRQ